MPDDYYAWRYGALNPMVRRSNSDYAIRPPWMEIHSYPRVGADTGRITATLSRSVPVSGEMRSLHGPNLRWPETQDVSSVPCRTYQLP